MKKIACFILVFCALPLAAAETSTRTWKNQARLSFLNATGNTNSTTLGFASSMTGVWNRWTLELPASALTSSNDDGLTAEQYTAGEKVRYGFSERGYAFERFLWSRDRFAGHEHRYDTSIGLGREWIKTERDNLLAELGGGYINEQRVAPNPRHDYASGRAYAKYVRKLSGTANASQDGEYVHHFGDSDDYRFNAETSVTASVTTAVSLKVSYSLKYANSPPPGFGKTDTLTAAAFVINY